IVPVHAPRVVRRCGRCGARALFASTGRFRVNASGRRLDAWLLYRCTACDEVWKAPLHQRVAVDALDPGHLGALTRNDAALARRCAFDLAWLARLGAAPERSGEIEILHLDREEPDRIVLEVPAPVAIRLDRLLARELRLSRAALARGLASGRIRLDPAGPGALRRPPTDGLVVFLRDRLP